jgi:hypothetical protein
VPCIGLEHLGCVSCMPGKVPCNRGCTHLQQARVRCACSRRAGLTLHTAHRPATWCCSRQCHRPRPPTHSPLGEPLSGTQTRASCPAAARRPCRGQQRQRIHHPRETSHKGGLQLAAIALQPAGVPCQAHAHLQYNRSTTQLPLLVHLHSGLQSHQLRVQSSTLTSAEAGSCIAGVAWVHAPGLSSSCMRRNR